MRVSLITITPSNTILHFGSLCSCSHLPRSFFWTTPPNIQCAGTPLLPHEIESLVGRLLALAATTFLPTTLPDDDIFEYWVDMKSLIHNAARDAGLHVAISTLTNGRKSWSKGRTSLFRVDVLTQGDPAVLKVATTTTKTKSSSRNAMAKDESTRAGIELLSQSVEREWMPSILTRSDQDTYGVSLLTLLRLGLSERDRRHIFHEILVHPPSYPQILLSSAETSQRGNRDKNFGKKRTSVSGKQCYWVKLLISLNSLLEQSLHYSQRNPKARAAPKFCSDESCKPGQRSHVCTRPSELSSFSW